MDRTPTGVTASLAEAIECAVADLSAAWVTTDQAARVTRLLERFGTFCASGFGIDRIGDVSSEIARRFVFAPGASGAAPSVTNVHLRRCAIRLLFRSARSHGMSVGDPTLDLVLPARSVRRARPLTDDEVAECRSAAMWSLSDSRHAAAWALAESTCRTGELPYIVGADIDVERGRVWLHGGRRTTPRWGTLTNWGQVQLCRRIALLGDEAGHTPLVYQGDQAREGGRISSSLALLDVFRRAGLADEPDIRPSSITAWAGRQILDATGRIDLVARGLGFRRLDQTADFIGWNWHEAPDE